MERVEMEQLRGYLGDYLRQKGLPVKKSFRCLNPSHEDRNPSMSYHRGAQNVHCFSCGITYDLFDLVGMDYHLDSFPDKLRKAAEIFGLELPLPAADKLQVVEGGKIPPKPPKKPLPGKKALPPPLPDRTAELDDLSRSGTGTYDYFLSRGISRESCEKYGFFETADRAWFPITEGGRVTGWCGRALEDKAKPRYKNSAGALGVWNGDRLGEDGGGGVLCITEGVIDAVLLEQMGFAAVSLCGSQNTSKLLRLCEATTRTANTWRFVVCGDGDDAGRRMNRELVDKLREQGLSASAVQLPEGKDVAQLYGENPDALRELLGRQEGEVGQEALTYAATSAAAALDSFFADCERRAGKSGVSTGLPGLDKLLDGGLHPGLYVMGAISSIGKTSLVLQMADCIAENEQDVLFVTLEQSRFELMAKSLSRISAALDEKTPLTVREILSGAAMDNLHKNQRLRDCREVYAATAGSLFFREGISDIGAADIREMVREHTAHRGKPPVVVVDYLQILKADQPRATDKQNVDRSVVELKRLSRDFDIPVVCISSFNRENYKAAVSMEAFKESGAVEYSADVLLGLQLKGAGGKDFDVNEAKGKTPRELELVILKNRAGLPYAKLPLLYDPPCNRFWEPKRAGAARWA